MNKLMIRGAVLFFLLMVSQGANAIGWVGAGGICASGSKNTIQLSGYCDWKSNTGAYYGSGQSMNFRRTGNNTGDNKAYVPKSGYYTTKVYWCAYPDTMDTCSKAKGSVLLVGDRVWMEQAKSFSQQQIFNHDQEKKAPSAGGYCFTITDDDGYEYRGIWAMALITAGNSAGMLTACRSSRQNVLLIMAQTWMFSWEN